MVRFVHSSNFFYLAREILEFTVLLDHPVSCLYRLAIIIIIIITSIIIMSTGWPPRKVDPAFKLNISRSPLKRPPGLQLRSMRSFFIPGKIKNYPMMNIFLFTTLILSVGTLLLLILAAFLVFSLASLL